MSDQELYTTDPTENWATSPFGFGPFPPPGYEGVVVPLPHPDSAGYGGAAWATLPILQSSMGGAYGLAPYGSMIFSDPPVPLENFDPLGGPGGGGSGGGYVGYGGDEYGLDPYGSVGERGPQVTVTGAHSINGYEIEVFFSAPISLTDPYLLVPGSYVLTPVLGAPATSLSVRVETLGSVDGLGDGALSVVVRHTGTTLGGSYQITVDGPGGINQQTVSLLTKGEAPPYIIQPTDSGEDLIFTFADPMLEHTGSSIGEDSGILDPDSYQFTSNPAYPIPLTPVTIEHPYESDLRKVHMVVKGMTSLNYSCNISPALAFDYVGEVLPSQDPDIIGLEINPDQGRSAIASNYLLLNKLRYRTYGWSFLDRSGKLTPLTTLRADFTFNAEVAAYYPPLSAYTAPKLGYLVFEDGPAGTGIRIKVTLQRLNGTDFIRVQSGAYDVTFQITWSYGSNTISWVRNRKADLYAMLFNGEPILSVLKDTFVEVSQGEGAGLTWVLIGDHFDITGFRIEEVKISSSATVYSGSWNFLHDDEGEFEGSDVLTRAFIMTRRGPLVKDWGDATPATKQDVEVLVDGTPVEVQDVNPYTGKITPVYPVPLLPAGDPQADVKVNYYWMATPIMEMVGLNTDGLVLNQWDRATGRHDPPAHGQAFGDPLVIDPAPTYINPTCRVCNSDLVQLTPLLWECQNPECSNYLVHLVPFEDDTYPVRFPMGVVLGPLARPAPKLIGHRYMGFERDYSALLNDPTTLLLNQDPYEAAVEGFERSMQGEAVVYDGTVTPPNANPTWLLEGVDSGGLDINKGTYTVVDAQSGPFEPGNSKVAMYYRDVDLTFPASVTVLGRFLIEDADSLFSPSNQNILKPDGVFTGVGFGVHDNHSLYLVGALLINGVEHVGMLADARRIHERTAWYIGPTATGYIMDSTTIKVDTATAPVDFIAGRRFQIFDHPQAGVYTATVIDPQCDGSTIITISPAFPADLTLYGNNYPSVVYEIPWSGKPSTYRLTVDADQKLASLTISGATTAHILTLDGQTTELPPPSETALVLNTSGNGQAFWGSLSPLATNRSKWSFFRYGIIPDFSVTQQPVITVQTEMEVVPEKNPRYEWFNTQSFGYSKVDNTGDVLILKSTSGSESLDFTYGYTRTEPYFDERGAIDLRCKFRMDSGVLGAGDTQLIINNGTKEIRLATILYAENFPGLEYRRLIRLPMVSMAGIQDVTQQGWAAVSGATATASRDEYDLSITQGAGQVLRYQSTLDVSSLGTIDVGYRILEGQLAVSSYTAAIDGSTGIGYLADVGPDHMAGIRLKAGATPAVQLVNLIDSVIQEYPFDWTDKAFHSYRLVSSGGAVSLFIDEELQLPTLDVNQFLGGSGVNLCLFGASNSIGGVVNSTLQSVAKWRALSYAVAPPPHPGCKRTLGIWRGGDPDHINSWELPRYDSSSAPNSELMGPLIQDMDWRNPVEVRLLMKPDWGLTLYRPDMPLPPYFQPESDVPGSGFANQTNEPSAGWLNLEYAKIPYVPAVFGFISFGALDKRSVSQQRWDWIRYRIFKALTNDFRAPQHMVLNWANVIASGEITKDVTLESVIVQTLNQHQASLIPAHIYAQSIYKIIDGNTILTRESWTFDQETQLITLGKNAQNEDILFSSENAPVNIIFLPGKPVTNTYLQQQPLLDGVTRLNEGTPPVPMSQAKEITKEIVYGSLLNSDYDVTNDEDSLTLTDPYRVLTHVEDAAALYEQLEFMSVDNGGETGLIAIASEGTLPQGFSGFTKDEGDEFVYTNSGSIGCSGPGLGGVGASADLCQTDELVGDAIGAHVLRTKGTKFWQECKVPRPQAFEQHGGMPGHILFCSGGTYLGPVVNGAGMVTGMAPLGGTLGPGTAILYPNFPSSSVTRGKDGGKIYRRTEWYMRASSVGRVIGGVVEDTPLAETVSFGAGDSTPPSRPSSWYENPSGTPDPNGKGACYVVQTGAGNYSHIGPWGGINSLIPTPDSGYFEFSSTIPDGTQVTVQEEYGSVVATFTARTVPVNPGDFAIAPHPHVNLAAVINNDPVASLYVTATPGLTWGGTRAVLVEALAPVSLTNMVAISTSDSAAIRLTGVLTDLSGRGLLTGGAKITQSSLVAGGSATLKNGVHDSLLGIVCEGGKVLPSGVQVGGIVYAATGP